VLAAGLLARTAGPASSAPSVPNFDHIFLIVMENHSYDQIIGSAQAPYINGLADQYGLATAYSAVANGSLPNYLALTGGSTFGMTDCNSCSVSAPNIATDRVGPSGRTWKAYMESMPSPCFVGDSPPYVQRHNPFIYYDDVRTNKTECNKIVPYGEFSTDVASTSTTPSLVWITPNLDDDMHDGTIAQGDTWLSNEVPRILNSPAWTTQRSLIMITWDEGGGGSNSVPTLVIASGVAAGLRSSVPYNHYSLLRTIESSWGLAPLAADDANAQPMSDLLSPSHPPPPPGPSPSPPSGPGSASQGYWLASADGGVFNRGGTAFYGSAGSVPLRQPIVAMAATPSRHGYRLAAADGGIFNFGDATYLGSTGDRTLNQPIVGMASTASGRGYWLVGRDGGIFSFGDAPFLGSTGGLHLDSPIVAMASQPLGSGYRLVGRDGGIFDFGTATYLGSGAGQQLDSPVTAMAATEDGQGYRLTTAAGQVLSFGDATSTASATPTPARLVVGLTAA
jgi:acid phosphatase